MALANTGRLLCHLHSRKRRLRSDSRPFVRVTFDNQIYMYNAVYAFDSWQDVFDAVLSCTIGSDHMPFFDLRHTGSCPSARFTWCLYGRHGKCRTTFLAGTASGTMHFAVPLFRPSNNNFPINLILGAVSRRNEIMFIVSLLALLAEQHCAKNF